MTLQPYNLYRNVDLKTAKCFECYFVMASLPTFINVFIFVDFQHYADWEHNLCFRPVEKHYSIILKSANHELTNRHLVRPRAWMQRYEAHSQSSNGIGSERLSLPTSPNFHYMQKLF